ncbi:MAG: glycosyltransferase family 32 protein [Anaerolineae bacterium]
MQKRFNFYIYLLIFLFVNICIWAVEADFINLMGKRLPCWKHVQTKEDQDNLNFYKNLFNKSFFEQEQDNPLKIEKKEKIPKVLHFIWLGPKNFPEESIKNIKSWIALHPEWTINFWTDRPRPLPYPSMKKCMVQDFTFLKLRPFYERSNNFAEKSDLLRYEVLFQQGGVYVDHDVKCLRCFDGFNQAYDLYCGLELPSETPLSSSIHATNNLIGARPGHPVLQACLEWLEKRWDDLEEMYPGNDRDSLISRIAHRTFSAFTDCIKTSANMQGNCDITFPAFYFNAPSDHLAIFARHLYAGTWFENETGFEKMTRERLMLLSKKTNKILLALSCLAGLNLIGFWSLFLVFKKNKQMRT